METTQGDLSWSYPNEELHQHFNDIESRIGIHFYGRRLYENRVAYWPTADENTQTPAHDREYARICRSMPKIVFSTTLTQVAW